MSARLDALGSRVVLLGTGRHDGAGWPSSVPAVATTLRDLRAVFRDACGVAEEQIRTVEDPATPNEFQRAIAAAAEEATEVLLIYYVGHGILNRRRELHLAVQGAVDPATVGAYQALPVREIQETVRLRGGRRAILVLDCCFAGRAEPPAEDGVLLAAAGADELAWAPQGAEHTTFSGAFIEALRDGVPGEPGDLQLRHLFRHLRGRLAKQGYPVPILQAGDLTAEVVLGRNPMDRPTGEDPGEPPAGGDDSCPYQGLQPYTTEDARLFAGRDAVVEAVLRKMRAALPTGGITVVSGPSGNGKTSLIEAGVVPAIRNGAVVQPGVPDSHVVRIRITTDPVEALNTALAGGPGPSARSPLLILVDQFEQLFVQGIAPSRQRAFVSALHDLSRPGPGGPRALVVLGLRSDFDGPCAGFPELVSAFQERNVVVGPMTTGELRTAVLEPARRSRFRLEPGLIERLLIDAGADLGADDTAGSGPGSLPLISQALLSTWHRRSGRTLTLAGYQATGGVRQAVQQTADAAFAALTAPEKAAARRLLISLVRVGAAGRPDTRGRIQRAAVSGADAEAALGKLADHRLVTVDENSVELAHEALIREWPLLRDWVGDSRAGLLVAQELELAAAGWRAAAGDRAHLYRAGRLAEARSRIDPDTAGRLGDDAREFLAASVRQQRRTAWTRRITAAALVLLTVLATTTAVLAVNRGDRLDKQLRTANAGNLAVASEAAAAGDPAFATRLALAAWRLEPSHPSARAALANRYMAMRSVEHVFDGVTATGPIKSLSASENGDMVLVAATGSTFTVVTGLTVGRASTWLLPTSHNRAMPSPDGRWVITGGNGTALSLWDVAGRRRPLSLPGSRPITAVDKQSWAFSWDGARLLVAGEDGAGALMWSLPGLTWMPLPSRVLGDGAISGIGFTDDPSTILVNRAVSGSDHLEVRSLTSGRSVRRFPAGATPGGGGRWVHRCVDENTQDGAPATVSVVRAATGKPNERVAARQPDCGTEATPDGNHLLPEVTSVREDAATIRRITSLVTGESYDFVLPYRSARDESAGDLTRLTVIDVAGGPPMALLGIGTAVLRLRPIARDPLAMPGSNSRTEDGEHVLTHYYDRLEVTSPGTGRSVAHLGAPAGVSFGNIGIPWTSVWQDGARVFTEYSVPGLRTAGVFRAPAEQGARYEWDILDRDEGGLLAVAVGNRVTVWDRGSGRTESELTVPAGEALLSKYRSDPHVLLRIGHPGEVLIYTNTERPQLWNYRTRTLLSTLPMTADTGGMLFDATGDRLIHLEADKTIQVWDVATGRPVGSPVTAPDAWSPLGITPEEDGAYVVTFTDVDGGRRVEFWDLERGTSSGALRLTDEETGPNEAAVTSTLALRGDRVMPTEVALTAAAWRDQLCRAFGAGFTETERAALPEGAPQDNPC
ncbi:hypothetical protein Acy02nite_08840 [Actinoplanes cyaneus]|uniref:Peptidase C14 caspase domain-containing protein n=1 Tax=Actinoplanes cyaneus TaxID=52696 RepID=A0A919ICC6_9ACTN|nr:caspase family protein [Actinoplanes cyaneus]MCW2135635.1 hypothetical protein [Actinoplanes cyaneus]GID63003.1 hypothetical protein Acy02nite_08840 [Actinoplanes cyaneus]